MLKGISPLLSPELLSVLCRMGHGDELVLADAHFPGETMGKRVLRADGLKIADLIDAILPVYELDGYVDAPLAMMAAVPGDKLDATVGDDEALPPLEPALKALEAPASNEKLEAARKLAKDNPAAVANIMRSWVNPEAAA